MKLIIGKKYKFKSDDEVLIYKGIDGAWNQFAPADEPDDVWTEVLGRDLYLMERVK